MSEKEFIPKRLLVTGGAGFIGSNFIRYIQRCWPKAEIFNIDKLTYAGSLDNLSGLPAPERHHFIEEDICNGELVEQLLRQHNIDTIVHFAAESHVDRSITGPEEFIQTNFVGTFRLLEAARRFWLDEMGWGVDNCLFHHISTDEVYGTLGPEDTAFSETTPYAPNSPYSASKAGSDHLVRAYHHTYRLPVTTTNCSNNYGPYQHWEKLIPTVIRCCHEGRKIPVYGDGSNRRDWLYVLDHCSGIEQVIGMGERGATYNIGGGHECSNIEVVRTICNIMDELRPEKAPHTNLITFVTDRPGHDWRYAIDSSKITEELGWQPKESFESGIRKTVKWYLELL